MSNLKIQVPPPCSATDRSSFAYRTIKDRLPVIIVKTIDFLHRQRKELYKYGGTLPKPNATELAELEMDAKSYITHLTKLRKDLETNKPADYFESVNLPPELQFLNDDIDLWNTSLNENRTKDGSLPLWFESPFLLVECYMYRRIKEAALLTKHLKMFDPFVEQKQLACRSTLLQMTAVSQYLEKTQRSVQASNNHSHPSERSEFRLYTELALWANKHDLSINAMNANDSKSVEASKNVFNVKDFVDSLNENILCDRLSEIWFKVQSIKSRVRSSNSDEQYFVDLVADNSGYELFVDLCLLNFLSLMLCPVSQASSGVKFRIHIKRIPWFVSDTTRQDVEWLLDFMSTVEHDPILKDLGEKWRSFISSDFWQVHDDKFWTLPYDFSDMPRIAPDLYNTLKGSCLIIFKGDLNYRKLVGDRKWHLLTPFHIALRDFTPAPIVALRTAKAEVAVGIDDINIYAKINNNELPRDWMISGEFGLIQYTEIV